MDRKSVKWFGFLENRASPILIALFIALFIQRVMPSGFFVLLRHFLRIDDVLIRMHDTRFHCEIENDYILKEYIHREAPCTALQVHFIVIIFFYLITYNNFCL